MLYNRTCKIDTKAGAAAAVFAVAILLVLPCSVVPVEGAHISLFINTN